MRIPSPVMALLASGHMRGRAQRIGILCALTWNLANAQGFPGTKTLYRRLEAEPATLNPILETSEIEEFVLADVSRNLIDADNHLVLVGGLCDRWEVSPDLRTLTFHLRSEAVWEDGSPVTSHDAVFTIERIVDPSVPAIRFASGLESFTGAREIDSKTFRVTFAKPYALRLAAFRFGLLPASRYEHRTLLGAPENRSPLSNGPYRMESWRTGEEIVLRRNDRYWGSRGAFDRIVFRIVPNQEQAYRALVRGDLDEMRLSAEEAAGSPTDPGFKHCCRLVQFYDLSFLYLGYNHRNPVFADSHTRRALTMLLDRQGIVDHLFGGAGRVLSGPWPASMPAYDQSIVPYPFDPKRARSILAEAGWHGAEGGLTRNGHRFQFRLLYTASSKTSREIAEIATASFAEAGIECIPVAVEWATLTKRLEAGDFDAAILSWANDLNPDLFEEWHSSQAPPRGMNSLSYNNPTVDNLIEMARVEGDPQKRIALFHRLHALLHQDEPATWLCQVAARYGIAKRIQGVVTSPIGLFRFWPGSSSWFAGGRERE
jgi:peptide/nickel transport system substrate-binding protein